MSIAVEGFGEAFETHTDERGSSIGISNDHAQQGRFGYTGQLWLPEIGMWYYKSRMYSPTLGRFMQTDPIGYADGLNWYAYVGNDPVNKVDPLGLCGTSSDANVIVVCADRPDLTNDDLRREQRSEDRQGSGGGGGAPSRPGRPVGGENAACKILRENSESTQDVLPGYVTDNDNWDKVEAISERLKLLSSQCPS